MLLALTAPPDHERGPQYMEQAFSAMHQANLSRRTMQFLFGRHDQTVGLYCQVPGQLRATVDDQLGNYPDCRRDELPDGALDPDPGETTWSVTLRLRPDVLPIKRYSQFVEPDQSNLSDPLAGILTTLCDRGDGLRSTITLTVRPATWLRGFTARRAVRRLASPFFRTHPLTARCYAFGITHRYRGVRLATSVLGLLGMGTTTSTEDLDATPDRQRQREEMLQAASDKAGKHLFEAALTLSVAGPGDSETAARAQLEQMIGAFGQFTAPRFSVFKASSPRRSTSLRSVRRRRLRRRGFLLSAEELATLWHPTTDTVQTAAMGLNESRELEAPAHVPIVSREGRGLAVVGRMKHHTRAEVFGMRAVDRRQHVYVIGKTGMGKSTLLYNTAASDIQAGRGVGLIDPHGDLAERLLKTVPPHRTNDVVHFDVGDRDSPVGFNVMDCDDPEQWALIAEGVVSAFEKLFGDSWGPRLEYILRNATLALLEVPGTTLLSIQRLLTDVAYRKGLAVRITDPVIRAFWQLEFAAWSDRYRTEAIGPVLNKVGQFTANPILRAVIGQSKNAIDLRRIMDDGKILIVNLSKGRIGEKPMGFLGSLLVTKMQLDAMSRADQAEEHRRDFYLFVDEFQNFATSSFATILSEARKYRLNLTVANQYLEQIEEESTNTLAAVFGNVGTMVVFQVGARDAETFVEQLDPRRLTASDVMTLPKYRAYVRLAIDGESSRPFSMETLPPIPTPDGRRRRAVIRKTSRKRYGRPAAEVNAAIEKDLARV